MKCRFAMILAAALMLLCGCGDDSPEKTTDVTGMNFSGEMTVTYQGSDVVSPVSGEFVPASVGKVVLKLYKVKFVPQMPVSLDINIPEVSISGTEDNYRFSADNIVPTYGEAATPVPMYTVSGLEGSIVGKTVSFSLSFGDFPTSFKGNLE